MKKKKILKHAKKILGLLESKHYSYGECRHILKVAYDSLDNVCPKKSHKILSDASSDSVSGVSGESVNDVLVILQYLHNNHFTFADAYRLLTLALTELATSRYV